MRNAANAKNRGDQDQRERLMARWRVDYIGKSSDAAVMC
jgi:hypothetical protein